MKHHGLTEKAGKRQKKLLIEMSNLAEITLNRETGLWRRGALTTRYAKDLLESRDKTIYEHIQDLEPYVLRLEKEAKILGIELQGGGRSRLNMLYKVWQLFGYEPTIATAKEKGFKLLNTSLGALDGLSKQELKTYRAILKDIRWAHEDKDTEFTGYYTDKLASHLAYKYGMPTYSVNHERLALAKERAIKSLAPLGDLPIVLRDEGLNFMIFVNDHEPPHVHVTSGGRNGRFKISPPEVYTHNDFDGKTTKRILKKIAENHNYLLKKWNETHKKT